MSKSKTKESGISYWYVVEILHVQAKEVEYVQVATQH